MLDKSGKIIIRNDKNEEVECDVLFTFDNNDTNKSYIVYIAEIHENNIHYNKKYK